MWGLEATEKAGVFDLHCDTLTAFLNRPDYDGILGQLGEPALRRRGRARLSRAIRAENSLNDAGLQFSLSRIPDGTCWAQCCAIFVPDGLGPENAPLYYALHRQNFTRQMQKFSRRILHCRGGAEIRRAWPPRC